jgi:hypothetical protein
LVVEPVNVDRDQLPQLIGRHVVVAQHAGHAEDASVVQEDLARTDRVIDLQQSLEPGVAGEFGVRDVLEAAADKHDRLRIFVDRDHVDPIAGAVLQSDPVNGVPLHLESLRLVAHAHEHVAEPLVVERFGRRGEGGREGRAGRRGEGRGEWALGEDPARNRETEEGRQEHRNLLHDRSLKWLVFGLFVSAGRSPRPQLPTPIPAVQRTKRGHLETSNERKACLFGEGMRDAAVVRASLIPAGMILEQIRGRYGGMKE